MTSSMTALVSAFARAYHTEHSAAPVYRDPLARRLLSDEEYHNISQNMARGIGFFAPGFQGTPEQALHHVVNHQLAPSPLGRAVFAERALENALRLGTRQYWMLGAGYDTFPYRRPDWARDLTVLELDRPEALADKTRRLQAAGLAIPPEVHPIPADLAGSRWAEDVLRHPAYDSQARTLCSLLGLTYYLPQEAFRALVARLGSLLPPGSALVFDYHDQDAHRGDASQRQIQLAQGAGEAMTAGYALSQLEELLGQAGFLLYEQLTPAEIDDQLFALHNRAEPEHPIHALDHVCFCLAVKPR